MQISAVSFDADQTLWDLTGVYQLGLGAVVAAIEAEGVISAGRVTVDALWAARGEVRDEYRGRPHRMEDVREHSFRLILEREGHPNPAAAAAKLIEHYLNVRFDAIRLYPEVTAVLARLREQFSIGLLTNGNTYPDRCGLPNMFHAEVFCPEYGVTKPDERAFLVIAEQLQVEPNDMVHIGDDWDDIAGANAVGATSVHINRTGNKPDFAADADHQVGDLVEFEALLAELTATS